MKKLPRLLASVLLAGSLSALCAAELRPMAAVPQMTDDSPAPGKRVRQVEPEYAGTEVYHSLYLPPDFDTSRKRPLIVELTGNTAPPERGNLGFSVTQGKDFVWIVLPYIAADGKSIQRTWWGDEKKTVEYAKKCVRRAIKEYNLDPERVLLCGFSRGAVGVGYIGLHDDEIAGMWTAFLTHDHFDGVREWRNTEWGSPLGKYRAEAAVRLKRLKGRPFWVSEHTSTASVEDFLREAKLEKVARFHFEAIPMKSLFTYPNQYMKSAHSDLWPLFPIQAAEDLQRWLWDEIAKAPIDTEEKTRTIQPVARVPLMTHEEPAPGRRVRQTDPEYKGTDVHHSLYLPPDFHVSKKHPLIVELTGNYFPHSGSTGEVGGANLGFAATQGKEYVWIAIPYIAAGKQHNEKTWWGDEKATVEYAKKCVRRAIKEYNLDPRRVILCGFSRGAIGVGYIGLYDDDIASIWSAFLTHDGFDGVSEWKRTEWGSPLDKYRSEATVRLKRLNGRPFWVSQHSNTTKIEEFLREQGLENAARFHFQAVPMKTRFTFPNQYMKTAHSDFWPLFPIPETEHLQKWLREEVGKTKTETNNTEPLLQPMAKVPLMTNEAPAPGKRVRQTEPEYAGTDVHHSLYLPPDFDITRKHPLIVELTGNYAPPISTGRVSGANLGFSATLGKEYVWIALPYVSADGQENSRVWWGDEKKTVEYAKRCVQRAIKTYNLDPDHVILCGFSRGAVGVGYIGLHDDEIAGIWSAFMTHDHFDGVHEWRRTTWGSPLEKYRTEATVRLKRLNGRPFWVSQHGNTETIQAFLRERGLEHAARFHFESIPMKEFFPDYPYGIIMSAHNDVWPLFAIPSSEHLRAWMRSEVGKKSHE